MKKPLTVALIIFVCLLVLFVKKTSGFTPSPRSAPTTAPRSAPRPAPEDDEEDPEPVDIKYKGPCNWTKFKDTGCDHSRGWCDASNDMCTTDFTQFSTYGKSGGICVIDEDCDTSGSKCTVTPPKTIYGTCSK